jgi:hypothetical protein
VTPDIAESIRDNAEAVLKLATDWLECANDPEHYAHAERMDKPPLTSWAEFSEAHRDVIAADLESRAHRLYALATARVA